MMSPIRRLDEDLVNVVHTIAPEKSESLKEIDKLKINFLNDKGFSFRVNTQENEMKLPTVALEYVWCSCYTFYIMYQEYTNAKKSNLDATQFNIKGNDRRREALDLYQWGQKRLQQEVPEPLRNKNITPELKNNEDIDVANELYLASMAWILHHELAHIRLKHPNSPINHEEEKQQEIEADNSATKWILEGICDEDMIQKRGLGIAIATLILTSQDILAGEFKEKTHPKSFQRLYDALKAYFKDEDHLVYAFSSTILYLNMALNGIEINHNDKETWKQNLESCLIEFSHL